MSTQSVLTVVGFAVGGPTGAVIGGAIGQAIDGPPDVAGTEGPRLESLIIQSSTYGQPIKRLYATSRIAGNIIQARPLNETRHESGGGGKGGPSTPESVTYTYTADFMVGLCAGEILGIRRIWADSRLIYDVSDTSTTTEIFASGEITSNVRIYTGSETQQPDPFFQADNPDTPAYRGLAYIAFEGLALEKYGNRIPNISCEVVSKGTTSARGELWVDTNSFVSPGNTSSSSASNVKAITYSQGIIEMLISDDDGGSYKIKRMTVDGQVIDERSRGIERYQQVTSVNNYYAMTYGGSPESTYMVKSGLLSGDLYVRQGFYSKLLATRYSTSTAGTSTHVNGELEAFAMTSDGRRGYAFLAYPGPIYRYKVWDFPVAMSTQEGPDYVGEFDAGFRVVGAFGWPSYTRTVVVEDNQKYAWVKTAGGQARRYLINDDGTWTLVFSDTGGLGGDFYNMVAENGVLFEVGGGRNSSSIRAVADSSIMSPGSDSLQSVVTNICTRSERLATGDMEVSDLLDTVNGYVISGIQSPRKELEPLMLAYSFDAFESDWKIKFARKGQSPLVTIPYDHLATHQFGSSRPDPLQQDRKQSQEIPDTVLVSSINSQSDYQTGEQLASRNIRESDSIKSFNVPIVLTADETAQMADRLLWSLWSGRTAYSLSLPLDYAYLDPSDVINVQTNDAVHSMVITDIEVSDGLLSIKSRSDEIASYVSSRTGAATTHESQAVGFSGVTDSFYIDGPLLDYGENSPGFYVAVSSPFSAWTGSSLYYSNDDGFSYSLSTSFNKQANTGFTNGILLPASSYVVDGSSLNITVGKPLSSISDTQFYNNENIAIIGDDGRWEVIAFRDAVLESDGSYTISTFLRGLQGTEDAIKTHQISDNVIILDRNGGILDVPAVPSDIGVERQYKMVSDGSTVDVTAQKDLTISSNRLKPLSPVNVVAQKQSNGDFLIKWNRRARYDAEWRDVVDVELGESTESYEIDITGETEVTVTKVVTTNSYTYTLAEQITDHGLGQNFLGIYIYQMSSIVGRGHPGIKEFDGYSYLAGFRDLRLGGSLTIDDVNHNVVIGTSGKDQNGSNFISQRRVINDNNIHIEYYRTQTGNWFDDDFTEAEFSVRLYFDMDADDVTPWTGGSWVQYRASGNVGNNINHAMIWIGMRKDAGKDIVVGYKEAGVNSRNGTGVTETIHNARTSDAFDGTGLVEIDVYPKNGGTEVEISEGGMLKVSANVALSLSDYSDAIVVFHHHNYNNTSSETLDKLRIN